MTIRFKGSMNHVVLNLEVLEKKVGPIDIVCLNSTDLRSSQEHEVWTLAPEKLVHGLLVQQIELRSIPGQQVGVSIGLQTTNDRRSHHAAVAGDKYF